MIAGSRASWLPCRALSALVAFVMGAAIIGMPARAANPIDYTLSVTGVKSSSLEKSIIDATELLAETRRPVLTARALRRRVETSLPRVTALLRARGYYAARQTFRIERKSDDKVEIVLAVDLGPVYRIGRYDIHLTGVGDQRPKFDIPLKTLGLKLRGRARSDSIAAADGLLLAALGKRGYPLARIDNRRIVVDHKARTMSVDIYVSTGPYARFGQIRIDGLESIKPDLITGQAGWKRGAPFDSTLLEKLRGGLRQTGLFSSVLVRHADAVGPEGEIDIIVSVKERKHRSIGAGGSFSTTEGLLGKLFWEHRNLWGRGELLRVRGEVGEIRQGAFGDLRIGNFGARDQDLVFDARATNEQPDGFSSIEIGSTVRLERRFGDIYAGSGGIGFEQSNVEDTASDRNFTFLTFPLSLRRDNSDDLLDPGKGDRDTLTFTPTIGIFGTNTSFYTARLFNTAYLPLMAEKKLVLAGWLRLGTIFGEVTDQVPSNKRLYSGGPGSVRGYALNDIGPLDATNDPIGGRSSTEFGAELRWRAFGPFGFVAFAEAGAVYGSSIPKWGHDLQWGAGIGVRYLTKIGPLRLDVAVPLNRRNAVDDSFQILVSLGQAF